MNLSKLRPLLYRSGAVLGDVSAARRGPAALGKRVVRKQVYRAQGRASRKILRSIGL